MGHDELAQAYICTNSIANLPLLKQPQNLYKFPALECPSCKFACICMHFTSETTTLGPRTQPKNDSYMRQEYRVDYDGWEITYYLFFGWLGPIYWVVRTLSALVFHGH